MDLNLLFANDHCIEFNFMDLREEILKILNSEVSDLKEGSDGSYEQVKAIDQCDFNDVAERLIKLFSIQPVIKCEFCDEEKELTCCTDCANDTGWDTV